MTYHPLIEAAESAADLSYGDPATRARYLAWLYPGDTPHDANDMGKGQYACLLHARACLRACDLEGEVSYRGRTVDLLRCSYKAYIGQIEGMLETLARARGWYETTDLHDVRPADILIVGYGGQAPKDPTEYARWKATWGGVAHGMVVTATDGATIYHTDGGQTDVRNAGRGTAILRCESQLDVRGTQAWIDGRRIRWRLRL